MAATTKGAVDIDSIRLDVQSVKCLLQKDRKVIGFVILTGSRHCWDPPGFITCLARLLNASGEKDSKN